MRLSVHEALHRNDGFGSDFDGLDALRTGDPFRMRRVTDFGRGWKRALHAFGRTEGDVTERRIDPLCG